jgi:hypothetical protein
LTLKNDERNVFIYVTRIFDAGVVTFRFNFHHPVTSYTEALSILSGENNYGRMSDNLALAKRLAGVNSGRHAVKNTGLWKISTTAVKVRVPDDEVLRGSGAAVRGETNLRANPNVVVVPGHLAPGGSSVTVSVSPDAVNKKLLIRELNRQLEGWTPESNTQGR